MSNLSDDTLRKILQQIQSQAVQSQRSLSLVKAQIQSKEKERRILQLTIKELDTVPQDEDANMYKGVGKMFVLQPRASLNKAHEGQEKTLTEDITNLSKKVSPERTTFVISKLTGGTNQAKYLEKQFEEANNQLRDIFHSQQRERQ
ncbi:prefoldin subunit 1, partial [Tremellales sp. Uapishka_1]